MQPLGRFARPKVNNRTQTRHAQIVLDSQTFEYRLQCLVFDRHAELRRGVHTPVENDRHPLAPRKGGYRLRERNVFPIDGNPGPQLAANGIRVTPLDRSLVRGLRSRNSAPNARIAATAVMAHASDGGRCETLFVVIIGCRNPQRQFNPPATPITLYGTDGASTHARIWAPLPRRTAFWSRVK